MKLQDRFTKAFDYFKEDYKYTMGGTQTVILPNGKSKHFDDREYYTGRYATRNNTNIRHDDRGIVKVSKKQYSDFLKHLRDIEQAKQDRIRKDSEKAARIEAAKSKGIYDISDNYVELSDQESYNREFDHERLANTLGISLLDAKLLESEGKTYVFANTIDGRTLELYHPSLDWNRLSIYVAEATPERVAEFTNDRDRWETAPFAREVGQTSNENHFVC